MVQVPYWLRADGDQFEIQQVVGGSRGTHYIYYMESGHLYNIKRLGEKITINERGRRKREEIVTISRGRLLGKILYEFSFTNSGYLLIRKYQIDHAGNVVDLGEMDIDKLRNVQFAVVGPEEVIVKMCHRYLPIMVKDIKDIVRKSGAQRGIFFACLLYTSPSPRDRG